MTMNRIEQKIDRLYARLEHLHEKVDLLATFVGVNEDVPEQPSTAENDYRDKYDRMTSKPYIEEGMR